MMILGQNIASKNEPSIFHREFWHHQGPYRAMGILSIFVGSKRKDQSIVWFSKMRFMTSLYFFKIPALKYHSLDVLVLKTTSTKTGGTMAAVKHMSTTTRRMAPRSQAFCFDVRLLEDTNQYHPPWKHQLLTDTIFDHHRQIPLFSQNLSSSVFHGPVQ